MRDGIDEPLLPAFEPDPDPVRIYRVLTISASGWVAAAFHSRDLGQCWAYLQRARRRRRPAYAHVLDCEQEPMWAKGRGFWRRR
jgi:hypothetical protein